MSDDLTTNNPGEQQSAEIPKGFDPLIDLPAGIADWPVTEQLAALQLVYGPEVRYGRQGLALVINDQAESADDWLLYHQTWQRLRAIDRQRPISQLAAEAQCAYQLREQQIIWALLALDFEPRQLLAYLQAEPRGHRQEQIISWELFRRHGPCPASFDPSHAGQAQPGADNEDHQLQVLQKLYGAALQQLAANDQPDLDQQQLSQLISLEGQFFWTAEHLGLDPGWALKRLSF